MNKLSQKGIFVAKSHGVWLGIDVYSLMVFSHDLLVNMRKHNYLQLHFTSVCSCGLGMNDYLHRRSFIHERADVDIL